jgi:3-hydroxyacyl-[acyl-carrier-protein] dehydratase
MHRLPQRYPFLMIDRVLSIIPNELVIAVKNVTVNEPYFTGHFPGNPVMPGVMIVEALAQAGGLLFDIGDLLCVLARIDRVRFRGIVRPGDTIELRAELVAQRASMGKARTRAVVGASTVATAEISYSFIDGTAQ